MKVGCYCMDLYCDHPEHQEMPGKLAAGRWEALHNSHYADFSGRTEASCLRQAKAHGWSITERRVLCPMHNPRNYR